MSSSRTKGDGPATPLPGSVKPLPFGQTRSCRHSLAPPSVAWMPSPLAIFPGTRQHPSHSTPPVSVYSPVDWKVGQCSGNRTERALLTFLHLAPDLLRSALMG